MSKKSVPTDKRFLPILLAGCIFLFMQGFVLASGGDDEVCSDSGNTTLKKKLNSKASEIAGKSEALYINAAYLQEVSEKEMEIENWMVNPNNSFWQENEISFEKWMFDIHSTFWKKFLDNDSEEFVIEDWMVNPSEWIKNTSLSLGNSR